jgi:formylglycine-generating enzyme required for sulfatase activity
MGSPKNEVGRCDNEDQVDVTLTKGFWMMETQVTQGLWQAAGGTRLYWSQCGESPDLPVYNVSHTESETFATQLTKLLREAEQLPTGWRLALPTEAQWEYAARAGTTTRFFFGDDESNLGEYAWFRDNSGIELHPVGKRKANPWGLLDVAGNVWEWCADDYGHKLPAGVDPVGPKGALSRVFRNGCWNGEPRQCRSASRTWYEPVNRNPYLGFRVAAVQD